MCFNLIVENKNKILYTNKAILLLVENLQKFSEILKKVFHK